PIRRIELPDAHIDIALPVDGADVEVRGRLNRDADRWLAIHLCGPVDETLHLGSSVLLLRRETHAPGQDDRDGYERERLHVADPGLARRCGRSLRHPTSPTARTSTKVLIGPSCGTSRNGQKRGRTPSRPRRPCSHDGAGVVEVSIPNNSLT